MLCRRVVGSTFTKTLCNSRSFIASRKFIKLCDSTLSNSYLRYSKGFYVASRGFSEDQLQTITRTCYCGEIKEENVDKELDLWGWVDSNRATGNYLSFVTLRDYSGSIQLVFEDNLHQQIENTRIESVIWIRGLVRRRPDGLENTEQGTSGNYEVYVKDLKILNPSIQLPTERFTSRSMKEHESNSDENVVERERVKLQQRVLYLRTSNMQNSLRLRAKTYQVIRKYLDGERFVEVETPTLFKRTSEGAREFLVPTSSQPGKFYALVQSPQQYKQLLMAGGLDRYYQIARCYRDEALRADRQPEFTQLDMELSCTNIHQVYEIMEKLIQQIWKDVRGIDIKTPFSRMSYNDALSRFGSDKPDTRFGFEIQDLTNCIVDSNGSTPLRMFQNNITNGGKLLAINIKGLGSVISSSNLKSLIPMAESLGASGLLTVVVNSPSNDGNFNWKTPIKKLLESNPDIQKKLSDELNAEEGDLLLFSCESDLFLSQSVLGKMRLHGRDLLQSYKKLDIPEDQFNFLWVTQFPLLSRVSDCSEIKYECSHHPFTAPLEEDIPLLKSDPEKVRGQHYDCVVNGVELGGGSIRIHNADLQLQIFKDILQLDDKEISHFQHLINALRLGCPPHGGIAFGLDRMCSLLANTSSIRDVIAFPKSNLGTDWVTGSPSTISDEELKEYNLNLSKENKCS